MLLSVPQLYIFPVSGFYVSLAFLFSLSLWPELFRERGWFIFKTASFWVVILILIQAASLLWSADIRLGMHAIIYSIPFLLIANAAYQLARRDVKYIYRILGCLLLLMIVEAVLVIFFRLSPEIEMTYYQSTWSGLFSNYNVVAALLDDTGRNNVLDPQKAGGLFVNGNTAAAYLGMGTFIGLTLGGGRSRYYYILAIILGFGVIFTGSKAGILLVVGLPVLGALLLHYYSYNKQSKRLLLIMAATAVPLFCAVMMAAFEYLEENSVFAAASFETAGSRFLIWKYAAQAFSESPVLGQGFGGWQNGFEIYAQNLGIAENFPPHNTLIYAWSQSGIPALLVNLIFIVVTLRLAFSLIKKRNVMPARIAGLGLGLCAGWLFIHGMAENWGLLGEARQLPIFAVLFGLAYSVKRMQ